MMGAERRLPGAAFSLFCRGKQWLGPKKAPAGGDGRSAPFASRAQSGARTAPALTRAGGRRRAGRIRAQKGSRRLTAPGGGGAEGRERNGTRWRERYAGTEPQSFGGGMRNMTSHDTVQGSSMNLPACGGRSAPAASRGQSGARTAPAQDARGRARARKHDTRAKRVPPPGATGPAAARMEWSGTERDGGSDMQERNRRASAAA